MTINEKLEKFKKCALNEANKQSENILYTCNENISKKMKEHEQNAKKNYKDRIKFESDILISKNNQLLSREAIKVRQGIEEKRKELVDKLFADLEAKLMLYKETEDYYTLLLKQIDIIKKYADEAEIEIFIDKSDTNLKDKLQEKTKLNVEICDKNILGGVKGLVKDKNILIDYSFASRIAEEKDNFIF